jgi:hypothetical protein
MEIWLDDESDGTGREMNPQILDTVRRMMTGAGRQHVVEALEGAGIVARKMSEQTGFGEQPVLRVLVLFEPLVWGRLESEYAHENGYPAEGSDDTRQQATGAVVALMRPYMPDHIQLDVRAAVRLAGGR